ncbi:MAG: HD domain-containing protein [Bacteroidales bacterium]|nr:HD domain-containing protein [Bacteroidales bacterium]
MEIIMSRQIIEKTVKYVKNYLEGAESGHNWWHIQRVCNMAMHIYSIVKDGDPFIIEMASLLHDIGDHKIKSGYEPGPREFMDSIDLGSSRADKITYIIDHISFRDTYGPSYVHTPELDIVQDADRLDAIGAIGIARAFNYGGSRGREIFNPDEEPGHFENTAEYIASHSSTINHFYEKLLKLKDMMNTVTGKQLAYDRHNYMEGFLRQFLKEWNGENGWHA